MEHLQPTRATRAFHLVRRVYSPTSLLDALFTLAFAFSFSNARDTSRYTGSTQALPFTTIILIMLIWLCLGFPLTVLGGILGKKNAAPFDAPCRTKPVVREIPPIPCYRGTVMHMLIGGFLPFSSISVELYYIFATVRLCPCSSRLLVCVCVCW
jgi:transmembrane 9 superfamily protein 1